MWLRCYFTSHPVRRTRQLCWGDSGSVGTTWSGPIHERRSSCGSVAQDAWNLSQCGLAVNVKPGLPQGSYQDASTYVHVYTGSKIRPVDDCYEEEEGGYGGSGGRGGGRVQNKHMYKSFYNNAYTLIILDWRLLFICNYNYYSTCIILVHVNGLHSIA